MWNTEDAKRLRRFLNSDTGKRLIEEFEASEPNMSATNIEGRALEAAAFSQHRADKNFIKAKRDFEETPDTKPPWIDTTALEVKD